MHDGIGNGQRCASQKFFLGGGIGSPIRGQMDGVELTPAPVQRVKRVLKSSREFRTVTERDSCR